MQKIRIYIDIFLVGCFLLEIFGLQAISLESENDWKVPDNPFYDVCCLVSMSGLVLAFYGAVSMVRLAEKEVVTKHL